VVAMGEGAVCRYRTGSFEVEPVFETPRVSLVVQMQRLIVTLIVIVGFKSRSIVMENTRTFLRESKRS
jgi:hypothetical protein